MSAARDVHVGTPAADFPLEDSVTVHYHNFASLPTDRGVYKASPKFTCVGYEWSLELYAGGNESSKQGMIGVFINNETDSEIFVRYDIMVKKSNGALIQYPLGNMNTYDTDIFSKGTCSGWSDYANRGNLMDSSKGFLNNGTLTFVVRMRPGKDFYHRSLKPQPTLNDDIIKLFNDEESADVSFEVDGQVFYAHKSILKVRAPELAELAEQYDKENSMPIIDVEQEIFEIMIKYLYGRDILAHDWMSLSSCTKQILEASGKYGFSKLKLEAEAWHRKNIVFTVDSVIDELLYADGKNCSLLKKAAFEFIVENGKAVLASSTFARLAESPKLMKEVMMEFAECTASRKRKSED